MSIRRSLLKGNLTGNVTLGEIEAERERLRELARNRPWPRYIFDKLFPLLSFVVLIVGMIVMWSIVYLFALIMPESTDTIEYIVAHSLKSMLDIESRIQVRKDLNVAVGFGSCVDIFISSEKLLMDRYEPPKELVYHESIKNQQELNEVFAYFFTEGAAAERYIDNRTFFNELVETTRYLEGARVAIGGNAPVMANRFIREGVDKVIVGTQHSKNITESFHDKLLISGPIVDGDDVHLIIEYPAGARWGDYVAPRANRLIIHCDYLNPTLTSMDNFLDRLASFKSPDLVVIGGLQMLDNIPVGLKERKEKLEKLGRELAKLPPQHPRIHLELASFTERALLELITQQIVPRLDSIGMNEQELPTLLNFMSYGDVAIRSETYPRVSTTLDQMRQLYRLLHKMTSGRLSRIHTHTLAFQAIMIKHESGWNNTLTSSVIAALTAHRYTCGSPRIDMAQAKFMMDESYTTSQHGSRRRVPFNPKHPATCWQESMYVQGLPPTDGGPHYAMQTAYVEICVAPVLVCTKVKQTGGAGDNVSAAGLIYQF